MRMVFEAPWSRFRLTLSAVSREGIPPQGVPAASGEDSLEPRDRAVGHGAAESVPVRRSPLTTVSPVWRGKRRSLSPQSYSRAEAKRDPQMEAWLRAHMHAFDYWGGVRRWPFPTIPGLVCAKATATIRMGERLARLPFPRESYDQASGFCWFRVSGTTLRKLGPSWTSVRLCLMRDG